MAEIPPDSDQSDSRSGQLGSDPSVLERLVEGVDLGGILIYQIDCST